MPLQVMYNISSEVFFSSNHVKPRGTAFKNETTQGNYFRECTQDTALESGIPTILTTLV